MPYNVMSNLAYDWICCMGSNSIRGDMEVGDKNPDGIYSEWWDMQVGINI